jgi:Holliday junction resolvase-like predicted endonuclease
MTDNELKELVANLAKSQAETDAQLIRTNALVDRLVKSQAKTDAQLAKTDAQLAKTDAQLAKTDALVTRLAKMYGGVGNNQGDVAEEFYFNSLKANPVLKGMRFEIVNKNVTSNSQGLEDEFDILMINGEDVFIIEVKYKAHEKDLNRLIEKKAVNFKKLFPIFSDFRHHLGLASFHFADELITRATDQGVTVLQRRGNVIETYYQ